MKLHSALDFWFRSRFDKFSEAQRRALPHTLAGKNTLILAPTGSGKTLAAFLSVLDSLARVRDVGKLPNKTLAVYVSPLRSLTRDIERNLAAPLAALGEDIRMEIRTGDTSMADRGKQSRRHPHLLLTTPESLSSLLSQANWLDGFACRTCIVDEIHSFAESKRGSLLALTLERLQPDQRIGLSATAHPAEAVARLLCGDRPCAIARVESRRAHKLEIAPIPLDIALPPAGFSPYRVAEIVSTSILQANCSLVFTSTRSAAERLGLALKVLLPDLDERIVLHHSSVERETRLKIEDDLAAGSLKACVCSTSLEMGLDFQAVDQVLLIGAPRGVSRSLQRLGRAGHRVHGIANGSLVPLSLPDLLECIALREAARAGRLDELRIPCAPLDVLAQVILGMSIEREWRDDDAFHLIRRAGPYRDLSRADFDAVLEYLAGRGRVMSGYGETFGRIVRNAGTFRVSSKRTSQRYYRNIGTISDDYQVKIVAKNRHLGRVEESFVASLQPGEAFVIGGRSVRIKSVQGDTATVEPAEGERVATPRWMGGKMSLTARLAAEELTLRRALRSGDWSAYKLDPVTRQRVRQYAARQIQAAPIPIDNPVQIERVRQGRSALTIFHVVAGRAVNRALAWVAGHRLGQDPVKFRGSIASNHDDHGFLLSFAATAEPDEDRLRECFRPEGWLADLRTALEKSETLGRRFRPVAETGQLLERRTVKGPANRRMSSWNGTLLYRTLLKHEPDHPLLRETVRETVEDELDGARALAEASRIYSADWEILSMPRPSPFALPMFGAFNREVLLAQNPDLAFEEMVEALYAKWA